MCLLGYKYDIMILLKFFLLFKSRLAIVNPTWDTNRIVLVFSFFRMDSLILRGILNGILKGKT